MQQLRCDVHTHTIFSRHAYSTISENALVASERGLELLGSADHFSAMLFEDQTIKNFQFFTNQRIWPRVWHGVRLLRACEADIVDLDGHLFGWDIPCLVGINGGRYPEGSTLQDVVFKGLDYVVASVHGKAFTKGASLAQTTDMYVHALQHPKVLIVGHPGRAGVPFDVREVVRAAKEAHKLVEINNHSLEGSFYKRSYGPCRQIAEACAEEGVSIAVSSDAHVCSDIGKLGSATEFLDEIHFPEELVATRSVEAFMEALHLAGLGQDVGLTPGE